MSSALLGHLAAHGIIERAGPRRTTLRVTPRFLAHAEGTAGRHHVLHGAIDPRRALKDAIETWGGLGVAADLAVATLYELMDARGQWGRLRG